MGCDVNGDSPRIYDPVLHKNSPVTAIQMGSLYLRELTLVQPIQISTEKQNYACVQNLILSKTVIPNLKTFGQNNEVIINSKVKHHYRLLRPMLYEDNIKILGC